MKSAISAPCQSSQAPGSSGTDAGSITMVTPEAAAISVGAGGYSTAFPDLASVTNNPPQIAAVPDQSVSSNSSLNVPVSVARATGQTVTVSAGCSIKP